MSEWLQRDLQMSASLGSAGHLSGRRRVCRERPGKRAGVEQLLRGRLSTAAGPGASSIRSACRVAGPARLRFLSAPRPLFRPDPGPPSSSSPSPARGRRTFGPNQVQHPGPHHPSFFPPDPALLPIRSPPPRLPPPLPLTVQR